MAHSLHVMTEWVLVAWFEKMSSEYKSFCTTVMTLDLYFDFLARNQNNNILLIIHLREEMLEHDSNELLIPDDNRCRLMGISLSTVISSEFLYILLRSMTHLE